MLNYTENIQHRQTTHAHTHTNRPQTYIPYKTYRMLNYTENIQHRRTTHAHTHTTHTHTNRLQTYIPNKTHKECLIIQRTYNTDKLHTHTQTHTHTHTHKHTHTPIYQSVTKWA
jgi:hypothetical protein